jgi:hypothetical protein
MRCIPYHSHLISVGWKSFNSFCIALFRFFLFISWFELRSIVALPLQTSCFFAKSYMSRNESARIYGRARSRRHPTPTNAPARAISVPLLFLIDRNLISEIRSAFSRSVLLKPSVAISGQ